MMDFGNSEAAKHAAAVINGDVPDVQLPPADDIFDQEEDDLDVFGNKTGMADPLGDDLRSQTAGDEDDQIEIASAVPKKVRVPRPKLDANVLCGDQKGLPALYARAKRLVHDDTTLSSAPGHELNSLRKIMNEYRAFAGGAFGSVDAPIFYEKCEKLGGGGQIRSLMELLRDRSLRGDTENSDNDDDDDDDNWGNSS